MYTNQFITKPEDLVTDKEARRAGFLATALRRSRESSPFLRKAKSLYTELMQNTTEPKDILRLESVHVAVLEAAGFSTKTRGQMTADDQKDLLAKFVKEVLEPTGSKYVDEVVYRYLMSLGEQLGGRMRNIIGEVARMRLTEFVISNLQLATIPFEFYSRNTGWLGGSKYTDSLGEEIKAIRWSSGSDKRMLVHNLNVPNVSKNVDIVVLNQFCEKIDQKNLSPILADSKNYVVLGELKGGIDPAGADEHWKTARGALERLRTTFKKSYICFIGGAIEHAMSREIFAQLTNGDLDFAANLNNDDQLSALCGWLVKQ